MSKVLTRSRPSATASHSQRPAIFSLRSARRTLPVAPSRNHHGGRLAYISAVATGTTLTCPRPSRLSPSHQIPLSASEAGRSRRLSDVQTQPLVRGYVCQPRSLVRARPWRRPALIFNHMCLRRLAGGDGSIEMSPGECVQSAPRFLQPPPAPTTPRVRGCRLQYPIPISSRPRSALTFGIHRERCHRRRNLRVRDR